MVQNQNLDLNSPAGVSGGQAIGRQDQAAGLRSMFGVKAPRVMHLACALNPDTTVTLSLGVAHALRHRQQKTLLIDTVPLRDRKNILNLAYPSRYDIAQVLENTVTLKRAVLPAEKNLWFASAIRMARDLRTKQLRFPCLTQRLLEKGFELDVILIAARSPEEHLLKFYAEKIEHLVVASPEKSSLIMALDFIRSLSVTMQGTPISVLIVGGESQAEGDKAFERLRAASQSLLEQPIESMGWIAATPETAFSDAQLVDPAGLVLPATLYGKIANAVAGNESPQ